jgi:hypothetical protein
VKRVLFLLAVLTLAASCGGRSHSKPFRPAIGSTMAEIRNGLGDPCMTQTWDHKAYWWYGCITVNGHRVTPRYKLYFVRGLLKTVGAWE